MDYLLNKTLKRYKLTAKLGSGGMGSVYKGLDTSLNRIVAIKVMHPQYAEDSTFRQRFLQEARVAANLDHPGIVKVYDFDEYQDILFIVMEFISGMELGQWLDKQRTADCWISVGDAVELVRQIALALQHAHECNVLHRDIKPANIMIKKQPAGRLSYRPVITDLGLAKLAEGMQLTREGESMGTPAYMSPEQALGAKTDARSDVYSLGILLYLLSVGQLPFASKTISEAIRDHTRKPPPPPTTIQPNFSPELEKIILETLAKDPNKRFRSAAALAQELETFLQAVPEIVTRSTLIENIHPTDLGTMLVQQEDLGRGKSVFDDFDRTPAGLTGNIVQVHSPHQADHAYPLMQGTTTIGRGQENDIVLEDPAVSRVHAHIEFDGTNCKVIDQNSSNGTFLMNSRLLPGVVDDWTPETPLRIGSHWLQLKFVQQTQRKGVGSLTSQPSRVSQGGMIGLTLDPMQMQVEPGQSSSLSVELLNQGSTVDHYRITVDGVPAPWVSGQSETIQLMPGEVKTVSLAFHPPRHPKSRAGRHAVSVCVSSQSGQNDFVEQKVILTIIPYSQFTARLHPQKVRSGAVAQVHIENQGNFPETYDVAFEDRGDEVAFEVPQVKITIAEGQHATVNVSPRPRKRQWLGGETRYSFNAKVSTTAGDMQTHSGEVVGRGLIPVWVLPIALMLCVLLIGSAIFLPPIFFPTPTITDTPMATSTPEPGMPILEEWCIYPQGDEPQLFKDCPIQVKAAPGQKLVIRWRVSGAEKVEILPLGNQQLDGQVAYEVLETKTITLMATNDEKITQKSIEIIVVQSITPDEDIIPPTPTQTQPVPPTLTPITEERQAVKLTAFDMLDMQTGWAEWVETFGTVSSLLRTVDGGLTWQDVTPPSGYPIGSRFFALDGQRAWAALRGLTTGQSGPAGAVWRTVDGGLNWQVSAPVQPHLQGYNALPDFSPQALTFLNEQYGWLVVTVDHAMSKDMLAILATSDGGQTWEQVADTFTMGQSPEGVQPSAGMPCQVSAIAFDNPQIGYMAGDCLASGGDYGFTILNTFDGGLNWMTPFTNPVNLPQALQTAISEGRSTCGSTGVENTPAGILVQHFCQVQESSGDWNRYYYLSLLPKGSNAWIGWAGETASFVSLTQGYSLGQVMEDGKRSLSATTDGGTTWQAVSSVTWQEARLDFLLPGQGFALVVKWGDQTYDSALVRTDDGGTSWTLVEAVLK